MSCFKPSNFVRTFESRNFSFNARVSSAICLCFGVFLRKKIVGEKERGKVSSGRRLSFPRAERGKRTLARVVNSSRKFDNWTERERERPAGKKSIKIRLSLSLSLSFGRNEEKDEKKITNLRVVDELGVAVAGGDGHVVVVVVVVVVVFFLLSLPRRKQQ